jgi:membrane peptidoglycan carboxypeptidase
MSQLVGGSDFKSSSFNRATQARRQAGSAFKPIIYAAALERGIRRERSCTIWMRRLRPATKPGFPVVVMKRAEYTLRGALKVSSNRAAAQLLQQIGISTAIYYAQRLGIASQLPMVPSLALGTGDVTLLELTTAYTAFANQGSVASPRLITHVEDSGGTTIYTAAERHTQAISPTTAYLMSSMLSDVISGGTGSAARAAGFKLPAAGKTGTTDNYADAWFVGYTPHLVAGIWFGLDRPTPIMRGGFAGVVAVPAWGRFMRAATAHDKPDWCAMPADVEKVAICRLSGARATDACRHQADATPLPATVRPQLHRGWAVRSGRSEPVRTLSAGEPPVYEDLFAVGSVPAEICPLHNPSSDIASSPSAADSFVSSPSPVATSGRLTSADIVLERVLGSDGVMRTIPQTETTRFYWVLRFYRVCKVRSAPNQLNLARTGTNLVETERTQ